MIISFFLWFILHLQCGNTFFSFHRDEPTVVALVMTKKDCIKEDVLVRGSGERKLSFCILLV